MVSALADLVNEVYAVAEQGLWTEGATRTRAAEIAHFTRAGEMAVAAQRERLLGCVRIRKVDHNVGDFAMLAVAPSHRSIGIGRELVLFAEQRGRDMGCDTMRLELLIPREWRHPSKEFLAGWYGRMGYTIASTGATDELYPDLSPLLATPCEFAIYRKNIRA